MLRLPVMMMAVGLSAGALTLSASAATVPGSPIPLVNQSSASNVQLAAHRNVHRRVWVYNRRAHGPRFAYRHGRYRYYYGGWWYPRPWWGAPAVGIAVGPGYGYGGPAYAYGEPGYGGGDPGYGGGDPGYGGGDPGYGGGDQGYGGGDPRYGGGDPGYSGGDGGDQGYADDGQGQGYADGGGDSHVQWCMNRYRTYDPQADAFIGNDGRPHRCKSPH